MRKNDGKNRADAPERTGASRQGRARRAPKPATPDRLERAAYHYLERFATSSENLRRVLMRRVERSAMLHDTDREEGAKAVDALVARFLSAGLLDDRAYAEARTASLHRQGKGVRAIRQALAQKGVSPDDAAAALDALTAEIGPTDPEAAGIGLREADFAAAVTYARRRRLGPYRSAARADNRERDLAALGRQGFGYDTARRVIEAEDVETLEAERDAALDPDAPL